jgi:hypothetical protein
MPRKFPARVRVTTATTGTGTITLGSTVSGHQAVPAALDGETIDYGIEDGTAWEEGYGVYDHAAKTLTRTLIDSSTGALLDLSGSAEVFSTISSQSAERHDRGVLPRKFISGLVVSVNLLDPIRDIDISVGACRNDADDADYRLTTGLTKKLDVAFAEGTNQGGLGTGVSMPSSGTMHVFAITKDADGATDAYADTSLAGANVPGGWTVQRAIGALITTVSAQLVYVVPVELAGGAVEYLHYDPPLDVNNVFLSAATLLSLSVPTGKQVHALFNHSVGGSTAHVYVSSPDQLDEAPGVHTAAPLATAHPPSPSELVVNREAMVRTDISGRIRARTTTSVVYSIATLGWIDQRI